MSAPATARTRVLSQARFELGTLLANGEQLLVSLILPLGALIGLAYTTAPSLGDGRRIDLAVPGVLALCVISAAFTAQAIATGFDRRYAVLRLLGTTPLGRDGLLWGKALATLAVEVLQWLVIGGVGLALGWQPALSGLPIALVFLVAGTWAFVALALLLAGLLRAEGVLAIANLVWVLLLVLGGVIVPRVAMSGTLASVAGVLPSAALADGLRAAFEAGVFDGLALLILLAWGIVATLVAARTFRWSD
ncbi:MAG: ABC transporter permease [Actinomycetales bacterium]|jgi:ABC-2 type transport system permease protein|nr:ABC transporter permease [Actinomycetales bacterium]HMT32867.1 ABC transporter permease [Dermatophilaceae bacterium]HOA67239.1 ABC transporter permease [Phycicoccus elongatus]